MLTPLTATVSPSSAWCAGAGSLLAQTGPSLSIPIAIVLFAVLMGLAITLSPSRRTFEIKRSKDE